MDQTIEKVSFCAPDRNFDKAFSYICRDGTTRRWICHCFLALKDSVGGARVAPCVRVCPPPARSKDHVQGSARNGLIPTCGAHGGLLQKAVGRWRCGCEAPGGGSPVHSLRPSPPPL